MSAKQELLKIVSDCLVPAVSNVFSTQASTKINARVMGGTDPSQPIDIVTTVTIKSSKYSGVVALLFPKKTFLSITNQMLGENQTEIDNSNADAASELLNIVYASGRTLINKSGHDFQPAIPTVMSGTNAVVFHGNVDNVTRIACNTEHGVFYMESSLRAG